MDVPTPSNDDPVSLVSIPQASPDYNSGSTFNIHQLPTSNPTPSPWASEHISAKSGLLNSVPFPPPRPSRVSDAITPPAEPSLDDLALATIAAAALPPSETLQRPSLVKSLVRNLRLPSFEVLGIATPHPDRLVRGQDMSRLPNLGPLSNENIDTILERTPLGSAIGQLTPNASPPDRQISPSAGPDNQGFVFGPHASETSRAEDSRLRPETDEGNPQLSTQGNVGQQTEAIGSGSTYSIPHGASEALWIADIVPQIISSIRPRSGQASNSQIRILTHALPIPSNDGYCFPKILSEIHGMLSPQRTTWISHWHAVSGRFNLSQLPTTPPSTPAAPHEGEDYFTTRVFDSAVAVPDYQQPDSRPSANPVARSSYLSAAPSTSPRPAVPPLSMEISITERYIPPSASSEFVNLFEPTSGRSLLSDRLVELSEESGSLIFIYPTRNGGRTFLKEYLGRVLDPLLRRMMIVRQLGVEVCQRIGRMPAVEEMPAFEELRARIEAFCQRISSATREPLGTFNKFSSSAGAAVDYSLVLAMRQEVSLAPDVWTDWWCRQEKTRIRTEFDSYLRENPGRARTPSSAAGNIPMSARARSREDTSEVGSMSYILEIMEGVSKGAKEKASQLERNRIEVGVFVIKKEIVREQEEALAMR